jgi:hypothetical protein
LEAPHQRILLDQPLVRAERLLERRRHVGPMRQVEVDHVGLQAFERGLDRLGDVARRQAALALAHRRSDLGDERRLGAIAARLHPVADDRLGFAALVAGRPGRIGVRRIDGVESRREKTIEQRERGLRVRRPAEHIAAEHNRGGGEIGAAETTPFHGGTSLVQRAG